MHGWVRGLRAATDEGWSGADGFDLEFDVDLVADQHAVDAERGAIFAIDPESGKFKTRAALSTPMGMGWEYLEPKASETIAGVGGTPTLYRDRYELQRFGLGFMMIALTPVLLILLFLAGLWLSSVNEFKAPPGRVVPVRRFSLADDRTRAYSGRRRKTAEPGLGPYHGEKERRRRKLW